MRTCTIYLDPHEGVFHEVICDVDPAAGSHRVILSTVGSIYSSTPETIRRAAERVYGVHVRIYSITEIERADNEPITRINPKR